MSQHSKLSVNDIPGASPKKTGLNASLQRNAIVAGKSVGYNKRGNGDIIGHGADDYVPQPRSRILTRESNRNGGNALNDSIDLEAMRVYEQNRGGQEKKKLA